jgi:inositol phosphorylceramide mannosyltransferase catalytic subunit
LLVSNKMTATTTIPKIIHQTWKNRVIPDQWKESYQSWTALESDGWEYKLWTDEDNRNLIRDHYPWFLKRYDSYKHNIMRCDAVRPFILYRFGGVYCDLDQAATSRFPAFFEMIKHHDVAISRTKDGNGHGDMCLTNAFMASKPGSAFWPHVFKLLEDPCKGYWWKHVAIQFDYFHVLVQTGPILISEAANTYKGDLFRIPPALTAPGHARSTYPCETPESALRILQGSSWHRSDAKFFKLAGDTINIWPYLVLAGMIILAIICIALYYFLKKCRGISSSRKRSKTPIRVL